MKQNTYSVMFSDWGTPVQVRAFTPEEAKILAQAQRIALGLTYAVSEIVLLNAN